MQNRHTFNVLKLHSLCNSLLVKMMLKIIKNKNIYNVMTFFQINSVILNAVFIKLFLKK